MNFDQNDRTPIEDGPARARLREEVIDPDSMTPPWSPRPTRAASRSTARSAAESNPRRRASGASLGIALGSVAPLASLDPRQFRTHSRAGAGAPAPASGGGTLQRRRRTWVSS